MITTNFLNIYIIQIKIYDESDKVNSTCKFIYININLLRIDSKSDLCVKLWNPSWQSKILGTQTDRLNTNSGTDWQSMTLLARANNTMTFFWFLCVISLSDLNSVTSTCRKEFKLKMENFNETICSFVGQIFI